MAIPKFEADALGSAIRKRRESMKLSQEELSEKAGVHRAYIGLLERGQTNVTFEYLVKVSTALDVSMAQLFKDAGI